MKTTATFLCERLESLAACPPESPSAVSSWIAALNEIAMDLVRVLQERERRNLRLVAKSR